MAFVAVLPTADAAVTGWSATADPIAEWRDHSAHANILGLPLVVVVAHGGRMLFIIIIVAQLLGCH